MLQPTFCLLGLRYALCPTSYVQCFLPLVSLVQFVYDIKTSWGSHHLERKWRYFVYFTILGFWETTNKPWVLSVLRFLVTDTNIKVTHNFTFVF